MRLQSISQNKWSIKMAATKPKKASASPKVIKETKKEPVVNAVGFDVGTMNLVVAKSINDSTETKILRNCYLEVDEDHLGTLDIKTMAHARIEDALFILAEDAYNFANIFGSTLKRPMTDGMIASGDIDGVDILAVMAKSLVGEGKGNLNCCYSVPASPLDGEANVLYHQEMWGNIIKQIGYKPIPLNEAVAVVYSECANEGFTGIGCSFGAGMTNVAVVFRGVALLEFSVVRGGDWIDKNAAVNLGAVQSRVTSMKEKKDFTLSGASGKRKEKRMKEAIIFYYRDLIAYVTDTIAEQLNTVEAEFPTEIPIILSGGTSRADGFADMVTEVLEDYEFPFDISEIRVARNPMTAVSEGCLIKALR